ncbi:MAG: hypothetical protein HRU19_22320 [Pseudobacteriovorax sp.]|nr:hypothetical protein [Pseudobacteriovorax sp.]
MRHGLSKDALSAIASVLITVLNRLGASCDDSRCQLIFEIIIPNDHWIMLPKDTTAQIDQVS